MRKLLGFLSLFLLAALLPLGAQDSLPPIVPDTTAITWPAVFSFKAFILANQAVLVTALTSLCLFLASKWPGFAKLENWLTRGIQFAIGSAMSYVVVSFGGTPDPVVAALVTGALSTIVGGAIFRAGRTQPGNPNA